jgi:hypothetical protein
MRAGVVESLVRRLGFSRVTTDKPMLELLWRCLGGKARQRLELAERRRQRGELVSVKVKDRQRRELAYLRRQRGELVFAKAKDH